MSTAVPVSLVLITVTLTSDFGSIIRGGGDGVLFERKAHQGLGVCYI